MTRYIDADELLKEMRHYACRPTKSALYLIEERAKHPADVVEVIRCRNCRHNVGIDSAVMGRPKLPFCELHCMRLRDDKYYCADGEKRTD